MNNRELKWAGLAGIIAVFAVFGRLLVPAHLTSLWMDLEFTDWVSPIANRLHGPARLYADGLHFPMPPLPYVLVRLLHPGGAVWIQENLLNYLFQGATLVVLYLMLAKRTGVGAAFAATMAAVPLFLALPKTILYDSMTQFMVSVTAAVCANWMDSREASRVITWRPLAQGAALGVLTLCKQSTGVGTVLGVCAVLTFLPAGLGWKKRGANITVVLAAALLTITLLGLALTPFIDFPGMIRDVFLTSSEPKGGSVRMLSNLVHYARSLLIIAAWTLPAIILLAWLAARKISWRALCDGVEKWLDGARNAATVGNRGQACIVLAVLGSGAVGALAAWFLPDPYGNRPFHADTQRIHLIVDALDFGLMASLILPVAACLQLWFRKTSRLATNPLLPCAVVCFSAAIFHSLSVPNFRWVYDNNPLIVVAAAFLLAPLVAGQQATRRWIPLTALAVLCVAIVGAWTAVSQELKFAATCTESWPEIRQLEGARLRQNCSGMRELIQVVRTLADPARQDSVLLLPNDPNVEAWFERDRPALSSAILFTDQYWDRYVDRDYAALAANPPKVIVIGPRGFWRLFSRVWHPGENEGVIRLIDQVQDHLLPARYELRTAQPIIFENVHDYMDVYVRKD